MTNNTRPRARASDPETSHEAAASMLDTAARQRLRILAFLNDCGTNGATSNEIDQHFGWDAATAGRRMKELTDMGVVTRTARRRVTTRGRRAAVYIAE
jgi:hypothetical protein